MYTFETYKYSVNTRRLYNIEQTLGACCGLYKQWKLHIW